MQRHYITKYMPQGVHFTWKASHFFQKVHTFCNMPPYYSSYIAINTSQFMLIISYTICDSVGHYFEYA